MHEIRVFGDCRFDPATGELWRGGLLTRLPNQPARLLAMLTSRPGELITRDELRRVLWDGDTHVDFDACLNHCARRIRIALGDTAAGPIYVETVPRRGYRFIAGVEVDRHDVRLKVPPRWTSRVGRRGIIAASLSIGAMTGLLAGQVAERAPWHSQMVDWLHQRLGPLPLVCYWPWG